MTRYEILIKLNDEMLALDTYDVDPIQLTFNIADIKEFGGRNSSFSKTIKLPETGNNRAIFQDIGSLDIDSNFNPNLKTEAWILVDSIVIFKGFLQLRNVITDLEFNSREYEVVIYADNDNFFSEIGDTMLDDLDYSELNHQWRKQNIIDSWTSDLPYFYPLIDYGYNWNLGSINGFNGNQVRIQNMFPSTQVKYIIDKIFDSVGYSYESEFFNSRVFKNLYIPFNQQNFVRNNLDDFSQTFSVGMTGDTIINTGIIDPPLVQSQNPVFLGVYRIPFSNESTPYGDPDNLYDTTLYEYEAPSDFIAQRFVCNFNLIFRHGKQLSGIGANDTVCAIRFKRSKNEDGIDIPPTFDNPTGGRIIPVNGSIDTIPLNNFNFNLQFGSDPDNDPVRVEGQISTDVLDNTFSEDGRFLKLFPTEKLWVEVTTVGDNAQIRADVGIPSGNIILANYDIFTVQTQDVLFNILEDLISTGEEYPYIAAIPKKFKQKDFITSIIKMFNLYIEPSKEFEKTLIIEPRDQFYQSGEVKDWTKKLDTTKPLNIQILGDLQANEIKLTYKKDSDFYSEDYFRIRTNNEVYGQYSEFIENDFVKGEKKIETEFASTPLVNIEFSNEIIIPQIFKVNNGIVEKSESKPRILTKFYSSTEEPWSYDDFIFFGDSGQPNNAKTMLSTSGFTNVTHGFNLGDVVTIVQNDGGIAQPWITGTWEIVEIPNEFSIVIDVFFSGAGGPPVGGVATPINGLIGGNPWVFENDNFNLYPYLGHFNHPLRPNYDINFGQTDGLYYETNLTTNQNLYEVYWKNSIEELTDSTSRIITGDFYLNAEDIADFKFNDSIFIDGQYYKINKITYDPTKTITSQVELIKSDYVTIPIQQGLNIGPIPVIRDNQLTNPSSSINLGIKPGNISTSSTNVIQGTGNIVTGHDNIVNKQDNIVNGGNNIVGGSSIIVNGNNNSVESNSNNTLVIGNDNNIADGISNSVIIGNNITADQSNTLFAGSIIFRENISSSNNNLLFGDLSNSIDIETNNSSIIGGISNSITTNFSPPSGITNSSSIIGGGNNTINAGKSSSIIGGLINTIESDSINSIIIGGESNILNAVNSAIIACSGITASQDNTVYIPNLVVVNSITPTGTTDTIGNQGQITHDDDYIYVKTISGWKRSTLTTF